jgi:hypothetical protein
MLSSCANEPVIDESIRNYEGDLPVDLDGSWERDYLRGDNINQALNRAFRQLNRAAPQHRNNRFEEWRDPRALSSTRDGASLIALARLTEIITRLDVFKISQNEHEIVIERKDDFAILCEFYDGIAQGAVTEYGAEVCGWEGEQFVTHLVLPDGVLISHRYDISPDGESLRVVTTASSITSRVPFTLNRFYRKYEPFVGKFNCVETLSMKRVCSTGEL